MVETRTRGIITMDDLKAGDEVRSAAGFTQVYGFGHRQPGDIGLYVRFSTEDEQTIEIASLHQLFVGRDGSTQYAKDVQLGDELVVDSNLYSKVNKIEQVKKKGIYQPYTIDGTLLVNGVLASNYCESASVELFGIQVIDKHTFKFMVYAPARMLCALSPSFCHHDDTTDGRIFYNSIVKRALAILLPDGYAIGETPNFLDFGSQYAYTRATLLTAWIIPIFLVERIGWFTIFWAAGSFWLFNTRKHRARKTAA